MSDVKYTCLTNEAIPALTRPQDIMIRTSDEDDDHISDFDDLEP
jgi:hypothetical protein